MSWSAWVSCSMASLALLSGSCRSETALEISGESTRRRQHDRGTRPSAYFDGKRLELHAARGETLGVTLRLQDGKRHSVELSLPVEVARVDAFRVDSLQVAEPSTDMYGPSRGRGRYPDVLVPVRAPFEALQMAYFDVVVSADARPGRYTGTLTASPRSLPVALHVRRARVNLDPDPLVWAFYLPREIARAHALPDSDTPELLDVEARYHALFRAHGVLLASDLPPARFPARRRFVRATRYWPVAVDSSSDAAIIRDVRLWLQEFRDRRATPFAIPIDEPRSREDQLRARHIAEVIAAAGGGRPTLLRGVTDIWSPIYGDAFDVYIAPDNLPHVRNLRAKHGERFWTYNGRPPKAGSMVLDAQDGDLRSWGWIAYRYDVELWYAWEALYYTDRYNDGGPTDVLRDPVTFDERSRSGSDFGNGDGLLAYPGPLPSLRLKVLRRGLTDRLLLRELEACGAEEHARAIAGSVVPRALGDAAGKPSWPSREVDWEHARRRVLDAIEEHCR